MITGLEDPSIKDEVLDAIRQLRGLSANTIRAALATASSSWGWLQADGQIGQTPFQRIEYPKREYRKAVRPDRSQSPVMNESEMGVVSATAETDDPTLVENIVDFIRVYVDRTHHGKEEDILFRALEKKCLGDADDRMRPVLVHEHKQARIKVGELVALNTGFEAHDSSDTWCHLIGAVRAARTPGALLRQNPGALIDSNHQPLCEDAHGNSRWI